MQKHIQHNKDERTWFFGKIYLSLYLKGFERVTKGIICERWVGDWTELQHIDPHSSGHSSLSFPFSWAAQLCIFSPTDQNFLSPGLYNNLMPTYFLRASHLYSIQPVDNQGHPRIPWYLWPDAPVIYTGAFLILQPGRVGGQYVTMMT